MSQQILVTGAGGYLGTVLVPKLLAHGFRVRAIDTWWFGECLIKPHVNLSIVKADVRNISQNIFHDISIVIDLAAVSNDPCGEAFREATWQINYSARKKNVQLAKTAGVRHYLMASSCSVYGYSEDILTEYSATNPLTEYAKANLSAEEVISNAADPAFTTTVLRMATLYGISPRLRLDLAVNSMIFNAIDKNEIIVDGCGNQTRPLLHVNDAASSIIKIIESNYARNKSEILNIGNNEFNTTINAVAENIRSTIMEHFGITVKIHHRGPQDLRSYRVSFDKLKKLSKWSPDMDWRKDIHSILINIQKLDDRHASKYITLEFYKDLIRKKYINDLLMLSTYNMVQNRNLFTNHSCKSMNGITDHEIKTI